MTSPTYGVLVDWDSDGGLNIGDFEQNPDGWSAAATGAAVPAIARSTTRAYHGVGSLLVTWTAGGSVQSASPAPRATFVSGRSYTWSAWVWVPSAGGLTVKASVLGVATGSASVGTNAWVKVSVTFTATSSTHSLQIIAGTTPAGGEQTWIDYARVTGPGEDLVASTTSQVDLPLDAAYGRDQARSLQPTSPGEATFGVDDPDMTLSPENSSSPLTGLLGPGRETILEATYNGRVYTLFGGNLDNYEVDSSLGKRRAKFSAVDAVARIKDLPVSTPLYPSVRTGDAINIILDAIGWTGPRDIDAGATTIRWWWAESDDAYQEMANILAAEGPYSLIAVGASGEFVFRDRHHRLLRTESTTSQVTFRDGNPGSDVDFDPPCTINFGWRDIINQVQFQVPERTPGPEAVEVWSTETSYTLSAGQSRVFTITSDSAFWGLEAPTQGTPAVVADADPDFVVVGGTVLVAFTRTSGASTTMTISATTALTVFSMRLRAHKVSNTTSAQKILQSDPTSIAATRGAKPYTPPTPWLSAEDAGALADIILGQRASRLPTVTFTVSNWSATHLLQQLSRDLSDRVTIIDSGSGFNGDCYIEHISHTVESDGIAHRTTFACEKVPPRATSVFRFDTAGAGFNDGLFGSTGMDDPTTMFLFDTAGRGFNQGLFAT